MLFISEAKERCLTISKTPKNSSFYSIWLIQAWKLKVLNNPLSSTVVDKLHKLKKERNLGCVLSFRESWSTSKFGTTAAMYYEGTVTRTKVLSRHVLIIQTEYG